MSDVVKQLKWKSLLLGGCAIGLATILVEGVARRSENYHDQLIRPSVFLAYSASKSQMFFQRFGFYFAKITDWFYLIHEFLSEDLGNILRPTTKLLFSWFKFFQGYYDYFTSDLTWTPWQMGTIGSIGVTIGAGFLLRHYTGYPKMTWVTGSYRWLRGYQGSPFE